VRNWRKSFRPLDTGNGPLIWCAGGATFPLGEQPCLGLGSEPGRLGCDDRGGPAGPSRRTSGLRQVNPNAADGRDADRPGVRLPHL
jgi:hypothetical protein